MHSERVTRGAGRWHSVSVFLALWLGIMPVMTSRRIEGNTDQAPRPAGPYSQSLRIGAIVHTAGQVGVDPETRQPRDGVEAQTRQALENVRAALAASGASMDDVLRVGVFLTRAEDFQAMNRVYQEFFSAPYPARSTVYVGLNPGLLVEIDALAVLSED